MRNLPKATEILEVDYFNMINQKKYFLNLNDDFNLVESNVFDTEEDAKNHLKLWDEALDLKEENKRLKEEKEALFEMITALRKFPNVNKVIEEVIKNIKE